MTPDFSMTPAAARIEAEIRSRRLLDLPTDWADEIICPHYGGASLINLTQTIGLLLGIELPGAAPLLPDLLDPLQEPGPVQRAVLVLIDGMGYRFLNELIAADPEIAALVELLSGGRGPLPLTSVLPSSTCIALSSLWKAAAPGQHGVVGMQLMLREFSMMADMLFYRPAGRHHPIDTFTEWGTPYPDLTLGPTLPTRLAEAGIPTYALLQKSLLGSGLSHLLHEGVEHRRGHASTADFFLELKAILAETKGQRAYVNAYWPGVDSVSHLFGARSEHAAAEIKLMLDQLRRVFADDSLHDGHTAVFILADHGHLDAPHEIKLMEDPRAQPIREALRVAPGGESRLGYLHLRNGSQADVLAAIRESFPEEMAAIPVAEALQAGLFGAEPLHPDAANRIGDVILMPRAGFRLAAPSLDLPLVSLHGGSSDWEMLVPLLWDRW